MSLEVATAVVGVSFMLLFLGGVIALVWFAIDGMREDKRWDDETRKWKAEREAFWSNVKSEREAKKEHL